MSLPEVCDFCGEGKPEEPLMDTDGRELWICGECDRQLEWKRC